MWTRHGRIAIEPVISPPGRHARRFKPTTSELRPSAVPGIGLPSIGQEGLLIYRQDSGYRKESVYTLVGYLAV